MATMREGEISNVTEYKWSLMNDCVLRASLLSLSFPLVLGFAEEDNEIGRILEKARANFSY